jgi:hypothetical protein
MRDPNERPWTRVWQSSGTGAVIAFMVVGALLRLRQFQFNRSLWLDEAMLAVNIASRSFGELFLPLDLHQNAPILFLLLEKLSLVLFGVNEPALRALPMVCGLLLLPLMALVGFRLAGPLAAVVAVSLTALSPALIRYANETKPYGVDAFAAALFAWLALRLGDRPSPGAFRALGFAAPVLVLLSSPSVFAGAAVWAGLVLRFRGERASLLKLAAGGALGLGVFTLAYLTILRPVANDVLVREAYQLGFLPPTAPSFKALPLLLRGIFVPAFFSESATLARFMVMPGLICGLVFVVSLIVVARKRGTWVAVILGGPLFAMLGAAALGLYPAGVPRLMVFLYPTLLLLLAAGIALSLPPFVSPRNFRIFLIAWCACLLPFASQAWRGFRSPWVGDDFRAAYRAFAERSSGEPVYVGARTHPAWLFYATDWASMDEASKQRAQVYLHAGGGGLSFENSWPRKDGVRSGEGAHLFLDFEGRREVLGIATGRRWNWPNYITASVDAGWAENEAGRLLDAARTTGHSCVWLLFGHMREGAYRPLREALVRDHAGEVTWSKSFPGAAAARICFPSS